MSKLTNNSSNNQIPSQAKVVIIGGGVMGCGLAYHLAHEGWTDIVLLEKGELTSGSTWHAAGQITHSTSSYALGKCVGYNIELYSKILEQETGQSVTWHGCGSFRLAYTDDELDWLKHTISVGKSLGFPMEIVTPDSIQTLHPFYNLEGVQAALHTPEDGHADPAGVSFAMAQGARQLGAKIIRRCRAINVQQQANAEWLVSIESGDIRCEHVVNAGGTYAKQVGKWSGLDIPCTSMTHHYLITEPVPEFQTLDYELPVIRDDRKVSGYIRMEQKSGLIGIYEKANPNTVWLDECPWEAEHELFEADYERIMPWLENAMDRMPVFAELGIKREVHGAISHPPDGNPLIGPAPGLTNYWLNCGCQIGIGWGPGLTRELARWMIYGSADISMREFDPRRYGTFANTNYQITKAKEDYLLRHEVPFPHFNRHDARPVKPSSLYDNLKRQGAVFEEVYGWERPRYFAYGNVKQKDYYSFNRPDWMPAVIHEVKSVRASAGIMDISAFAKVEVTGNDSVKFVNYLIPNNIPSNAGRIILTHLLNPNGRIELETTIVRVNDDTFYFTCAAFFEQRLLDHLQRFKAGYEINITNRSSQWGALTINGPKSRDILSQCTEQALGNEDFPWLWAKVINIANCKVLALKMSYAGELGWEFHGDQDSIKTIYNALWQAGQVYDIVNYGSFAMNAMRLEKMFKGASELTNEVNLVEADVMRFVKLDKADFIGKSATIKATESNNKWRCCYFEIEVDNIADGNGGEAILYKDNQIGLTSSIAYCPSVDKILAFGYIEPKYANEDIANQPNYLKVMIMGNTRNAKLITQPPYDPANLLPRS